MSHVVALDLQIESLECLSEACEMIGLKLNLGQKTYRWWGHSVGDYPIPAGFTEKDLGKCLHAISIPNDKQAYEIGVVPRRDGEPGFALIYDFYGNGQAMKNKVGADGGLLKQAYTMARTKQELIRKGYRTLMTKKQNGTLRMETV